MHLRPISCPPGLWSVLLLPLSTDTRKQRSGVWPAGRNGVCLVCLAVATSLLWHSLVTSKLGTPCSQPSSNGGNAELPLPQSSQQSTCKRPIRREPASRARRSTRTQHTGTCIKRGGPVRQAQRVSHTHLVPVAAAAFGKLPSCVLGQTQGSGSRPPTPRGPSRSRLRLYMHVFPCVPMCSCQKEGLLGS